MLNYISKQIKYFTLSVLKVAKNRPEGREGLVTNFEGVLLCEFTGLAGFLCVAGLNLSSEDIASSLASSKILLVKGRPFSAHRVESCSLNLEGRIYFVKS